MSKTKEKATKKRPGPKPELFPLYPLKFDEALAILIKAKPRKQATKETEDGSVHNKKPQEG